MPLAATALPFLNPMSLSTTLVEDPGGPEVLPELTTGDTEFLSSYFNEVGATVDVLSRVSTGGCGIFEGLTLSASGLTVTVAVGKACIDGLVVLASSDTRSISVPSSTSTVFIWLRQSKAMTYTTNTTPPSGKAILLGMVTTDASTVTATDYSGVLYMRGGQIYRETGDDRAPGDSPGSSVRLWTKTTGGMYYWNGSQHLELVAANASPRWTKIARTYQDLQTAATTNTITLVTLPIGAVVQAVILDISTAFLGASISAMTASVGISGTPTKYVGTTNVLAAGSANTTTPAVESRSATTAVVLKADSTGANLSALSQGAVNVYVLWSAAA